MIEKLKIAGQVHSAGNGKLALDFIETNCNEKPGMKLLCPDVIFVDIKMPVIDGFEFLKIMEQKHQPLLYAAKVFMLSGSDSQDDIEKSRSFNIDGFISKPLTEKKIIESLFKK